jgi:hypothetical protein
LIARRRNAKDLFAGVLLAVIGAAVAIGHGYP